MFTDVRYGFVGHNAWVGEIGADGIAYPIDGLTLTARPAAVVRQRPLRRHLFRRHRRASRRRPASTAYHADGGLLGAGVELGARYLFNERWGVEGAASWDRLVNDAADSPITETGSDDQYRVRVGITRRISLDF